MLQLQHMLPQSEHYLHQINIYKIMNKHLKKEHFPSLSSLCNEWLPKTKINELVA